MNSLHRRPNLTPFQAKQIFHHFYQFISIHLQMTQVFKYEGFFLLSVTKEIWLNINLYVFLNLKSHMIYSPIKGCVFMKISCVETKVYLYGL